MKSHTTIPWLGLLLGGCGPQVLVPVDEGGTTGADPTTTVSTSVADTGSTSPPTSGGTSVPPNPTSVTGVDTTTVDPDGSSGHDSGFDPSVGFIADPEFACHHCTECDVWAQNCPRGEKCMPWANDGGNAWNARRCTPIDENPDQIGDPCTVEGSAVSGIDSCDVSAMCWDVDPETNIGTCVPFCGGSEANPTCDAMCDSCRISNEGVLILCLPLCHPAAGACPDGQACWPIDDSFSCIPIGDGVALGEVCDDATACDDGLRCLAAAMLPSCAGAACCAPWCATDGPDPCPGAMPGTVCQPLGLGEVPGCVEGIGFCAIPG